MTNVRKSPLLRFADNDSENFRTYTVYLSTGKTVKIYIDKPYHDGLVLPYMPYEDFIDAWLNCAIAS